MPYKASDNMSKHDTINQSQLKLHLKNLDNFCNDKCKNSDEYKKYKNLCATYLDAGKR